MSQNKIHPTIPLLKHQRLHRHTTSDLNACMQIAY